MTTHTPVATIEGGCLIRADMALLNTSIDSLPQADFDFSRVSTHELADKDTPWGYKDYGWVVVSVAYWSSIRLRCILSREGEIRLYGPGGKPDHTYQIPEAGVFGDSEAGFGYANRIRAIGDQLYVCGQARQVYQFSWDGKDLSSGQWLNIAGEMRQSPMSEPPDDDKDLDQWLDDNDSIDLVDIHGASPQDIYVTGDQTWHFNGSAWRLLELPTDEPMAAIKVLDAKRIVLVGHNGSLLIGNSQEGFQDLSTVDDNQNFVGVEWFDNKLWLASNFGLFIFDPLKKKIEKYTTSLQPDLQDTHQLEAKDGVLWSFGFKDLAYFDGKAWTRVDHPDNQPIR
jgi:hypothetical protein